MSAVLSPLAGAKDRLLPASLPVPFFAAALGFHVIAWLALAATAEWVPGFAGGLGPPLGVLHLFTLGVLVMVAIGAALQLLPVALRAPMPGTAAACAVQALLMSLRDYNIVPGKPSPWIGLQHYWEAIHDRVLRPELGSGDPIDGFVREIGEVVRAVESAKPSPLLDGNLARDALALCHRQSESVQARQVLPI